MWRREGFLQRIRNVIIYNLMRLSVIHMPSSNVGLRVTDLGAGTPVSLT